MRKSTLVVKWLKPIVVVSFRGRIMRKWWGTKCKKIPIFTARETFSGIKVFVVEKFVPIKRRKLIKSTSTKEANERAQNGGLGSGAGRCQLSDGHGDEQTNSGIEQENYLAGSQVRQYWQCVPRAVCLRVCVRLFFFVYIFANTLRLLSPLRSAQKCKQKEKKMKTESFVRLKRGRDDDVQFLWSFD